MRKPLEVKRGVTRLVILAGDYAVKVPNPTSGWGHFLRGLLANMQERTWSEVATTALCPVRFALWGGWLVVMDRCDPVTMEEVDTDAMFERMPDAFAADLVEHKACSFGRLRDGRVVAVDYGS